MLQLYKKKQPNNGQFMVKNNIEKVPRDVRSAESGENHKLRKRIGLNEYKMGMSKLGRYQVSRGVSVPYRHAKPVANDP